MPILLVGLLGGYDGIDKLVAPVEEEEEDSISALERLS